MEGEIKKGTSLTDDLHHMWLNAKALVSTNTDEAILEEIERDEKAAVETYDEFLTQNQLPHSIRRITSHQRNAIVRALHNAEQLEEVYG